MKTAADLFCYFCFVSFTVSEAESSNQRTESLCAGSTVICHNSGHAEECNEGSLNFHLVV